MSGPEISWPGRTNIIVYSTACGLRALACMLWAYLVFATSGSSSLNVQGTHWQLPSGTLYEIAVDPLWRFSPSPRHNASRSHQKQAQLETSASPSECPVSGRWGIIRISSLAGLLRPFSLSTPVRRYRAIGYSYQCLRENRSSSYRATRSDMRSDAHFAGRNACRFHIALPTHVCICECMHAHMNTYMHRHRSRYVHIALAVVSLQESIGSRAKGKATTLAWNSTWPSLIALSFIRALL